MERSAAPLVPTVERTDSKSSYWQSSVYLRERRLCRYILIILSVTIVIAVMISLVFIAHDYFHNWGGQGFLKARKLVPGLGDDKNPRTCLPLRTMARPTDNMHEFYHSGLKTSRSILPFYTCGDQQNSCGAYFRADICCPVGMSCYSTPYATSGTFCCDSAASNSECQASQSQPPQCPSSSFECAAVLGGGCCSNGTTCSGDGCIEFDGSGTPPPVTSTYVTTMIHTTASKAIVPSSSAQQAETVTNLVRTTITTTATMVIGGATTPTATVYKQGAVGQKAEGASAPMSGWHTLQLSCSPSRMLVVIALGVMLL